MGFSSGSSGGSSSNPANSLTLFTNFANALAGKGSVKQFSQAETNIPGGVIKSNLNPFAELLKTIEQQFAARPQNEFLGNVSAPFGAADEVLEGVQTRARELPGRISNKLKAGVLGRTDQAAIAGVEASRRAGGLTGDASAVAATSAASAAAAQNAAIGQIEGQAEIAGLQTEAGIAGQRAGLAGGASAAEQFGAKVVESRFAQELGTRVGARENFLNLLGSLAGASTSGIGGATTGGGSSNFGASLK